MTDDAIKALIAQGVADALAEYEANRGSGNGDDSHDSRTGKRRQAQQQPPKKQNMVRAYSAGSSEKKENAVTLPMCNKCKFHHNGPCTVNQMHDDIMAAGSKERPSMFASGSHAQFKKLVEGENTEQEEEFIAETYQNTTDAVRKLIGAEVEVVYMILNEIDNDIYYNMDACLMQRKCGLLLNVYSKESLSTFLMLRLSCFRNSTFKNIYKPTKNNLRTSSNTRNKNVATSPRTGNDRQTGQFKPKDQLSLLGIGKL
nr:hypothetical protein [Tanacetum cinerariifolium]